MVNLKSRIKVCHLTTAHPLLDTRIFYKQCKTLQNSGYDVYLITSNKKDEEIDGIKIIALSRSNSRFRRIFFNTFLVLVKAIKIKADIYHFHDPELIPVGMILKVFNKKVIYDAHENVPNDIMVKDWIGNIYIRKIISFIVNLIELFAAFLIDGVISVAPDIQIRFKFTKSVLIQNLPIRQLIDNSEKLKLQKFEPIIIYAGDISRIRGIKEIVQSMAHLKSKAKLWLLGNWESDEFRKECERLEGWNNVIYLGYKNLQEVYGIMKISDIAIINFLPIKIHFNSLPNKPFEYMACSLPIIMSGFPKWKELFKDCAIFVNPENPNDIAEKIDFLLNNEELRKELGGNGRGLIVEKYSWEAESIKLLDLYKNILN